MVARTVARYSWVWTLSVLACTEAASLDLSGLSIQQSDKEKTPAVTVDTDDWVVFRLIDEDARPVAGARVSRDVALDDPRLAGRQLDWSKSAISDANGLVAMRRVDIFAWWTDKTTPYILHEGRGIGAAPEIAHKSVSGRLLIVLKPVCHVHGTLTTENVPKSISLTWMDIIVRGPKTSNWMLHGGFGVGERQDFHLLLAPGKYSLSTYVMEDAGQRGSYVSDRIRHEKRTIAVAPGQRNLDIGEISFRPTKAWSLIGQPAPEIGPIKEWRNGSPVTLADLRGQVVWLHLGGHTPWPTASLPGLVKLHDKFGDKGLTILAIYNCSSMEELDRRWAEAYEKNRWIEAKGGNAGVRNVSFRIAIDGGESTFFDGTDKERPGATYARYEVDHCPTDILIDPAGNVVEIPDSDEFEYAIPEMLGLPVQKPKPIVWQPQFNAWYRLEDHQILKYIAPPFIPERAEYFRDKVKGHPDVNPMIPSWCVFRWDGDSTPRMGAQGTGPANLETILQYMLGLKETEYEAPQDLLQLKLPGDWVLRTNASLHAKFLALEGILATELGRKIRFEYQALERNVIVATGVSRLRVPADSPEGDPVHLYATEGKPDSRGSRWSSDRTDVLFRMLSHRTKMPVVDRTDHEDPTDISYFCEHPSIWLRDSQDPQEKHRRLQLLFDRLAEQTLLHLEIRTEPLPTWCISEQSDRGAGGSAPNAPGSTQKPDEPFLFNLADSRSIAETGNVQ
jgi:hypothetical protein